MVNSTPWAHLHVRFAPVCRIYQHQCRIRQQRGKWLGSLLNAILIYHIQKLFFALVSTEIFKAGTQTTLLLVQVNCFLNNLHSFNP